MTVNWIKICLMLVSFSSFQSCLSTSAKNSGLAKELDGQNVQPLSNLQVIEASKPLHCSASKATLFSDLSRDHIRKISIKTDLVGLVNQGTQDYSVLGLVYDHEAENIYHRYIPAAFQLRGNSRKDYCRFPPLKVVFLLDTEIGPPADFGLPFEVHSEIVNEIEMGTEDISINGKLNLYYNQLANYYSNKEIPTDGFSQPKDNMFYKLGDDAKLYTHCGSSVASGGLMGGIDYPAQKSHVLAEFYIYEILNLLKTTILNVSLVDVQYLVHDNSFEIVIDADAPDQKYGVGFFIESVSKMAKRCGLQKDFSQPVSSNFVSEFQAALLSYFVVSLDFDAQNGLNIKHIFDQFGAKYYSPFDFDTSGIIVDIFHKNKGPIEDNQKRFIEFLEKSLGEQTAIVQILFLLDKKDQIKRLIDRAGPIIYPEVTPGSTRFHKWFDLYFSALEGFIEKSKPNFLELIQTTQNYIDSNENR